MNLLVWNCGGLGNSRTGRELEEIIRAKDPSVTFIAETWADKARLEIVQRNIDFQHECLLPKEGQGGGIALFWKASTNLVVVDSSNYFIDPLIDKGTDNEWRFMGFYGDLDISRRIEAWDRLRTLNYNPDVPWLCAGDFNEIIRQDEKKGGAIRSHGKMQLFRDVIEECGFMDLSYVGTRFTWSKHFADGHSLWERLDRGMANNLWFMKFPGSIVNNLHCNSSNHYPLLINLSGFEPPPRNRPYRFEEMLLSNERCAETVDASWSSMQHRTIDNSILKWIETCGKNLAWWNRNIFGNVRKELEKKRAELIQAEKAAIKNGQNHQVRELKEHINVLLDREAR